jgi:hypothetical protein
VTVVGLVDSGLWTGNSRRRRVHQIFNAFAVNRADGENFLEAELGKFIHAGLFGAMRVHLVDRNQNGLAAAQAQFLRDFAVQRHNAFLHIDDEDDDVRGFDGQIHLLHRGLDDDVAGFFAAQQADAAGVHEREGASVPFGLGADAVARDARLVMHDGDAPSDDAVEQRGLADIGAADDGD